MANALRVEDSDWAGVWVGLVEVVPEPGNEAQLEGAGAYVQVVAPASSEGEFRRAAETLFAEGGFRVIGISDAEPFSDRLRYGTADRRIRKLAKRVAESRGPAFDERWHIYERDDDYDG